MTTSPVSLTLTRLPMDHMLLRGLHDLRDRGRLHRRVMQLFGDLGGDAQARARGGILFRVDADRHQILVQSGVTPVRTDVASVPLPDLAVLPSGMPVRLRACVNAVTTKNRTRDGAVHQTREPVAEEKVVAWCANRFTGLQLTAAHDVRREVVTSGRSPVVLTTLDAEAVVTNGRDLAALVAGGVGRARAYGGGLISVAPVRR